jgi:hypothetical protein
MIINSTPNSTEIPSIGIGSTIGNARISSQAPIESAEEIGDLAEPHALASYDARMPGQELGETSWVLLLAIGHKAAQRV